MISVLKRKTQTGGAESERERRMESSHRGKSWLSESVNNGFLIIEIYVF